ncbi:MAG: sigma-70 family RNA polymerase sigma factor [bacterium]|nr:sigma-70 family RNA polymerase sigma factor [bacterium]
MNQVITGSDTSQSDPDDAVARAVADFQAGIDRGRNFRLLFDRFYQPVKRFFAKRVAPEDCLDLTQETFLGLYRGLDSFRGEAQFATWLFRIAHTTHLGWLRRRKVREDVRHEIPGPSSQQAAALDDHQPVAVASEKSPLEQVLLREHLELLRETIEELPEKMQKCLKLRVYQELSYQEITDFMGISIETVKAHLFQARKRLGTRLQDAFGEIDF